MLKKLSHYRKHIIIASSILVLFIQATVFIVSDYGDLKSDIETGQNYFNSLIHQRFEKLEQNSKLITHDHALKAAITTFNGETVHLALLNHKRRLNADLMAVMSTDKTFFASTTKRALNDALKSKIKPVIAQGAKSNTTAVISLNDTVYQITIVPLRAPRKIAYIINGFIIDKPIVDSIKDITSLEITLVAKENSGKTTLAASTMSDKSAKEMLQNLGKKKNPISRYLDTVTNKTIVIKQNNASLEFVAFIEKPWKELINKYLISVFYLVFIIGVSVMRFMLRRMA